MSPAEVHSVLSRFAEEAIGRIARLYAVEKEARGSPPHRRAELRRAHAAPVFDDLERWLALHLTTISGKSPLAGAIRYALTRMQRLTGLRRVASDAIEARIGSILTRLLPDTPGDPLRVPLRIELHPGSLCTSCSR